jgi:hypothetical protein
MMGEIRGHKSYVQKLDEHELLKINEKSVLKGIDFQQLMSCSW